MELIYSINFILISLVNLFFFFSGERLNFLVLLSFWRSVQLPKKLCYFMIMVLTCCDLLVVLTNNPLLGKLNVNARWPHLSRRLTVIFVVSSWFAVLMMSFDRYLATLYPIFHRVSETKGRLLTLFLALVINEVTGAAMSANEPIISFKFHAMLFCILAIPTLFVNYKLLVVVRKSRNEGQVLKPSSRFVTTPYFRQF